MFTTETPDTIQELHPEDDLLDALLEAGHMEAEEAIYDPRRPTQVTAEAL